MGEIIKYSGQWNIKTSKHLLNRTLCGPTLEQLHTAMDLGMDGCIDKLLDIEVDTTLPINFYFNNDPDVPVGETWVDKSFNPNIQGLGQSRNSSLTAWLLNQCMDRKFSIKEKMMLFLHNHLVVSDIVHPHLNYNYFKLLRRDVLGNFKELVKNMTIEPAMLKYLNGNDNTATAPNENYARELLELFTIGKGPLLGDGDYTNYTEQDVAQIAKCLSGWVLDLTDYVGVYRTNRHNKGDKQLSSKFDNAVIHNSEAEEYKQVINIIFSKNEVSKFICRQLYIWFVNSNIDDTVESEVIEPLSQLFRDNDYNFKIVLRSLLGSEHFYQECNIGSMVRSPMDFVMSLINTGNIQSPQNIIQRYQLSNYIFQNVLKTLDQAYLGIPSVAGWKAYYQEPVFYRYWLSSVSLPLRKNIATASVYKLVKIGGIYYGMDLLGLVVKIQNAEDPTSLIKSLSDMFMSFELSEEQYDYLKTQVLLPGLPDYEWTDEYNAYLDDPNNTSKQNTINNRLKSLLGIMLNMPEFQLM